MGKWAFLASTGFSALTKAISSVDSFTEASGRLKLVTSSIYELKTAKEKLLKISNQSRVDFTSSVETYARLGRALKELNPSQKQPLSATETINKAIIVSGASAASAQAALVQLGQGFASGALRGEELNSVLEQTPRLAEAIVNGMGVSVGKLKELGMQGKLTSEAIFNALISQSKTIDTEFAKMPETVARSLNVLKNNALNSLASLDSYVGVVDKLSSGILFMGENLNTLTRLVGEGLIAWGSYRLVTSRTSKELYRLATTTTTTSLATGKLTKKIGITRGSLNLLKLSFKSLKATMLTFAPTAAMLAVTETFLNWDKITATTLSNIQNIRNLEVKEQIKQAKILVNELEAKKRSNQTTGFWGYAGASWNSLDDKNLQRAKNTLKWAEAKLKKIEESTQDAKNEISSIQTPKYDEYMKEYTDSIMSKKEKIKQEFQTIKESIDEALSMAKPQAQKKQWHNSKFIEIMKRYGVDFREINKNGHKYLVDTDNVILK